MASAHDLLGLGILAICINVTLMVVKIGVGLIGNRNALVADGIESASDIFSSLITWAGFQLSLRPPDENHPYGHGKLESLAGMFSGSALLMAAAFIAYQSVHEILTPHHAPAWFTLPVLVAVVVVKEVLSRRVMAAGAELDSAALEGDAWHHRSDAITSGAAAIGIAVALIGGPGYESADDWGALAACVIIVINGILIFRRALHDVLDGSVPKELQATLDGIARATSGVESTEKCRIRKSGVDLFVDIHVRVAPAMTVVEGHRVSHMVKARLLEQNPRIKDVLVHIEPA